ncbi:alpha/beta hydrolase [Ideonella sp. B7]|uniref:alpha/beta fold hydrolase n=1 Tax=Ideonella benzenivorans TaxID=2831643 RepID=UPI001CED478D|nr:alpha/beta hydrolase [Ideonella benzenivorans]MCA6217673.1 alpha/beta hydrolase [Ideonella benzenivorans]
MDGTLVFSHGNSFPAGTYRQLFRAWEAAGLTVRAVPMFGHDAAYPVASNWRALRDQLIDFIDALGQDRPVWLVGHSMGGLLSLMAACRRPDLARGLVMLDSPLITGWRAQSVAVFKRSGLIRKVSPGKVSQQRRYQWPDRDSVHAHFAAKPIFARWAPQVLDDYVEAGFVAAPEGGLQLRFHREVETRIYNTLPDHLGRLVRRHPPRCPVGFIAGTRSVEMRQGGVAGARTLAQERFRWLEGTHLYPMERPDDTAREVLDLLSDMR